MTWRVVSHSSWITASPISGTIQPSSSGSVFATINNIANTLPVGTHTASLQFINDTNPATATRVITLNVTPFTRLVVVPITSETFSGRFGGPFS